MSVLTLDEVQIDWARRKEPGKLTFTVLKDSLLDFQEGNSVKVSVNGVGVFYGFVFTKSRNKDGKIKVVAYDQLRYLKNKDTYVYSGKRADEIINMIAKDFRLNVGSLANTSHRMAGVEDNQELFEIIQNALDETTRVTGKIYVLYDLFGKLTLKEIANMRSDLIVNENTAEDYDYESSIDKDVYNRIKIVYEDKDAGKRNIYISQNSTKINQWGLLQHYETIEKGQNGKVIADTMIKMYGDKRRKLKVSGIFGDFNVRPGTLIPVVLNVGDIMVNNYMMVEDCTHKVSNNQHTMDLTLIGGANFVA